jgi:hypothetical protein
MVRMTVRCVLGSAALCAALLGASGQARADLYSCKQKDGTTLITNKPCGKGDTAKKIVYEGNGGGGGGGGGGSTPERFKKTAQESRERLALAKAANPNVAVGESAYEEIIRDAAKTYNLPASFIKGVIKVESNFHPHVVSRTGAMGLMQLMPGTANFLGVKDPFDPKENIFGGAKLLRYLADLYNGDINRVLAAYNAGEGAVDKYKGIPYAQTQEYVRRVYHFYKEFQRQERVQ